MKCTVYCLFMACLASFDLGLARSASGDERKVTAADMPRIPPTEPGAALETFRLAKGFRLELVAAEPMVSDPVAACFDERGRMFVAEMHGYPFSQEATRLNPKGGGKTNAGIIRMLVDTDQDGRMDQSSVFAEGMSWPTSICCFDGGVFVLAPEYLYYFKDSDGDGRADVKEVILSGFGRGNVQAVTNGLLWGLDNKVYFAAGRNPAELQHRGKALFNARNTDIRFDPRTEVFQKVAGGLQFGHSRDDWGVRFLCSNSNHIQQVVFPSGYLDRNAFFSPPQVIRSIAADGASARVYRRSPPEPWRIIRQKWRAADKGYRLQVNDDGGWEFIPLDPNGRTDAVPTEYPVGFFTSATGITVFRGDAYPGEFYGNVFIGDVGGNLVHRKNVDDSGVQYVAERADAGQEFLASTDNWFRPVNFVNAPDGCLYVLDMYRETIEHPYSIPDEIKQFLDLTSGHDRGRIYRIVGPDGRRNRYEDLGSLTAGQLVDALMSTNSWTRDTAHRLLWERQENEVAPLLEDMLSSEAGPVARLHALYCLSGMNELKAAHVKLMLGDNNARVREHAVRLAEQFLGSHENLLRDLEKLSRDESARVRLQVGLSLGQADSEGVPKILAGMLADPRNNADVRAAVYSSARDNLGMVGTYFLETADLSQEKSINTLRDICRIAGANPDPEHTLELMRIASTAAKAEIRFALLTEIGNGLLSRGSTIRDVFTAAANESGLMTRINNAFADAGRIVGNAAIARSIRVKAVQAMAFGPPELALDALYPLLNAGTHQAIQSEAIRSLGNISSPEVGHLLIKPWKSLTPLLRREVVASMLSVPDRLPILLDAVEGLAISPSDIELTAKQQLLEHNSREIRTRSRRLMGTTKDSDRAVVVESHSDVLQMTGRPERGEVVFRKVCAVCHRVGNIGHDVAPNLASVRNKSTADLLVAILDPNRESQPNFNSYTVLTRRGRSFSGIVSAESEGTITLRAAEAKEVTVQRSNIEEMISTGKSLMPEGLEKELSRREMADLIAFIKQIGQK